MSSELDAVKRIIEAFEGSDWQELDVRYGDLRVHLSTANSRPSPSIETAPSPDVEARTDAEKAEGKNTDGKNTDGKNTDGKNTVANSVDGAAVVAGAHVVAAPAPGTFWRAPEPGAPSFTDVGETVTSADTLCIIEVMKLMNHVKAEIDGRIVAVHAENGDTVDKEQPLFSVTIDDKEPTS